MSFLCECPNFTVPGNGGFGELEGLHVVDVAQSVLAHRP